MPIVLAVLVVMGALPGDAIQGYLALGELALDGTLQPVNGVLPTAVAAAAREQGLICPEVCGGDVDILASNKKASGMAWPRHLVSTDVAWIDGMRPGFWGWR